MTSDRKITLGEFLRHERELKGVTIEQMASATKIGVKTLHALESDHYSELPAKPFIRGFVSSYARFLGLDPKDLLTRFGTFIDEKMAERPIRDKGHSGYAFEKPETEQSRTVLWVVLGSFMAVGSVLMFFFKPSLHRHKNSGLDKLRVSHVRASPRLTPNPIPSVSETIASTEPFPTPTANSTLRPDLLNSGLDLVPAEIKHKVIFRARADVWVRYRVDEKPMMKFILRTGKVLVLRAREAIRFQTSNPKGVELNYNGNGFKVLSDEPSAVMRGDDLTLFLPTQLADTIQEPFVDRDVLHSKVVPLPRDPHLTQTTRP